jgi:hypothetical protein
MFKEFFATMDNIEKQLGRITNLLAIQLSENIQLSEYLNFLCQKKDPALYHVARNVIAKKYATLTAYLGETLKIPEWMKEKLTEDLKEGKEE